MTVERATPPASRVREAFRPVGRAVFSEPFEQGRLRLDGTPPIERQLAVIALVTLVGLMVVLLFGGVFRHATLFRLADTGGRWAFVPLPILPLTLVALFAGWLALLWGAMRGRLVVALAGAVAFLIMNGTLGRLGAEPGDSLAARWAPVLGRVGYLTAFGVVVAYGLVNLRPAWGRRARPVALVLLAAALAALFGSLLWQSLHDFSRGLPAQGTLVLDGAVEDLATALFPVVLLSAAVLVDFSYNLATAVTSPALELRALTVKVAVAALILAKLWIQLGSHLDQWRQFLRVSPSGLLWVVVSVAAFGAVAFLWRRSLRRRPVSEATEEAVKERIIYAGILAEVLVAFVVTTLASAASSAFAQTNSRAVLHFLDDLFRFTNRHSVLARTIPWIVLLLAGLALAARGRTHSRRELGLGLLLLGAWNTPFYALAYVGIRFQYSSPLLDIVLTVAVAAALLARWRHIDRFEAVALGVVVVFSWLVFQRGDFFAALVNGPLSFLGVTSAAVVVFGIVYTLLADSAVASGDGRWFPRDSRLLLYLGYLALSVTLLVWISITHPVSDIQSQVSANGFSDIGIPLAAWLVIRRPMTRREAEVEALPAEAAAFEVDDEEPPPAPIFTE